MSISQVKDVLGCVCRCQYASAIWTERLARPSLEGIVDAHPDWTNLRVWLASSYVICFCSLNVNDTVDDYMSNMKSLWSKFFGQGLR